MLVLKWVRWRIKHSSKPWIQVRYHIWWNGRDFEPRAWKKPVEEMEEIWWNSQSKTPKPKFQFLSFPKIESEQLQMEQNPQQQISLPNSKPKRQITKNPCSHNFLLLLLAHGLIHPHLKPFQDTKPYPLPFPLANSLITKSNDFLLLLLVHMIRFWGRVPCELERWKLKLGNDLMRGGCGDATARVVSVWVLGIRSVVASRRDKRLVGGGGKGWGGTKSWWDLTYSNRNGEDKGKRERWMSD